MDSSSFQEALNITARILQPLGTAFYFIILVILFVLKLVSGPVLTALQPLLYLLYALYSLASLPFRLIAKLEPVYDYIGAAVIVGALIGLTLNYSFQHFDEHLDLEFLLAYLPNQGRSVKQYRQSKVKEEIDMPPMSPYEYTSLSDSMGSTTQRRKTKNLLDQTILEEEDDSEF